MQFPFPQRFPPLRQHRPFPEAKGGSGNRVETVEPLAREEAQADHGAAALATTRQQGGATRQGGKTTTRACIKATLGAGRFEEQARWEYTGTRPPAEQQQQQQQQQSDLFEDLFAVSAPFCHQLCADVVQCQHFSYHDGADCRLWYTAELTLRPLRERHAKRQQAKRRWYSA